MSLLKNDFLLKSENCGKCKFPGSEQDAYDLYHREMAPFIDRLIKEKIVFKTTGNDDFSLSLYNTYSGTNELREDECARIMESVCGIRPRIMSYNFLRIISVPNAKIRFWSKSPDAYEKYFTNCREGIWFQARPIDILRIKNILMEYEIKILEAREKHARS